MILKNILTHKYQKTVLRITKELSNVVLQVRKKKVVGKFALEL